MNLHLRLLATLLLLGIVSFATGCSGRKKPELAEVEGIVKINGEPAANVIVKFMPDLAQGNQGQYSEGTTDDNGHYSLVCYKQGPGAVIGWHKVLLSDLEAINQRLPGDRHRIGPKYSQTSRTPISVEVKAGKQTIDLEATPPGI
jgi:hypothetical protein